MRDKYIEESFPRWFIFGVGQNDVVDVNDGHRDIVKSISRDAAESIIRERETSSLTP